MTELDIKLIRTEKSPKDCVGKIFITADNVYSCLTDIEDMIKSNQYFAAVPYEMIAISQEDPKIGDWQYNNLTGKISKRTDSFLEISASNCFKVEYTTDQELDIKQISLDFVKEYVNSKRNGKTLKFNLCYTIN